VLNSTLIKARRLIEDMIGVPGGGGGERFCGTIVLSAEVPCRTVDVTSQ